MFILLRIAIFSLFICCCRLQQMYSLNHNYSLMTRFFSHIIYLFIFCKHFKCVVWCSDYMRLLFCSEFCLLFHYIIVDISCKLHCSECPVRTCIVSSNLVCKTARVKNCLFLIPKNGNTPHGIKCF